MMDMLETLFKSKMKIQSTGLANLPPEILNQIFDYVSPQDLRSLAITSRALNRHATPYVYRKVFFYFSNRRPPDQLYKFASVDHVELFDSENSTQIYRPHQFLRTLNQNPRLASNIDQVSMMIGGPQEYSLKECLALLKPRKLHLKLFSEKNLTFAISKNLTSLDFGYAARDYDQWYWETPSSTFRSELYSLFMIESLRHLCLREIRSWNRFEDSNSEVERVGTSGVVSLSLIDTVPVAPDLVEVLTWPKALKYYYHDTAPLEDSYFPGTGRYIASPARFLNAASCQAQNLEEISYNNVEDSSGTDGSLFDPELLQTFMRLKQLTVPVECLSDPEDLSDFPRCVLPNLEKLTLDLDGYVHQTWREEISEGDLNIWLTSLLRLKKECFPLLESIVLRECLDWPLDEGIDTDFYIQIYKCVSSLLISIPLTQISGVYPNLELPLTFVDTSRPLFCEEGVSLEALFETDFKLLRVSFDEVEQRVKTSVEERDLKRYITSYPRR